MGAESAEEARRGVVNERAGVTAVTLLTTDLVNPLCGHREALAVAGGDSSSSCPKITQRLFSPHAAPRGRS